MKKPELLAPAGNMEALKQAIHHGADAVYLGGSTFSARAFADNFSPDALKAAVYYAHLYGKKVYITVNTLIGQNQWDELYQTLSFLNDIGVDAVILQDLGAAKVAHACFPHLPWHASTQMHNHNEASVKFAKNLGAERIVLAREIRLDDITALKHLDVQTEVFIHGAICIAYSGQCLFSALTQGRSGNKGACAQVCRMRYRLQKTEQGLTTEVPTDGEFLLSPKDLGVLGHIGDLMDAGIDALKIEGRMKSPEYVGYVTALYRRLIDDYAKNGTSKLAETDTETLARLFNRGFTQGLLLDAFGQDMMSSDRPNHRGVKIGRVTQTSRDKISIALDAPLNQGDGIKFENADKGMIAELIYKNGLLVNGAQKGDTIQLDNKPNLMGQDTVLLTQDKKLNERLASLESIRIPVDFSVSAHIGQPLTLTLTDGTHTLTETGGLVASAQNTPTDADTIQTQLARLGDTVFELSGFSLQADDNIFIPKSELNQMRRALTEQLAKARTAVTKRPKTELSHAELFDFSAFSLPEAGISVLVRKENQYKTAKDYPFVRIYTDNEALYAAHQTDTRLFLQTPRAGRQGAPQASRLLVTETGALGEMDAVACVADHTLNTHNIYTLALLLEKGAGLVTLSPELTDRHIESLVKRFTQTFGFAPPLEATIYGRHELMLTKNCIVASALKQKKACDACKTADYSLKDMHGKVYPIRTDAFCHTHIFETDNVNRLSDLDALKALGVQSFRLSLLDETEADCTALFDRVFR